MFKNISIQNKVSLGLWGVIIIAATIKALLYPEMRSVFDFYFQSGQLWSAKADLYSGGRGFIYFPTFACLMAPLSFLGFHFSGGVWELAQATVLVSGLYVLSYCFKPKQDKSLFLWVTLATLPIAFSSLRNTQANILMLGIMLWAIVAIARQRWTSAAVLLALGLAIKPTFIVFFLLTVAVFRPLWKKTFIATAIIFLLPFATNSPSYVLGQYIGFVHMLEQAVGVGVNEAGWANFLNIWPQLTGHFIPHTVQTVIRLLMALLTLLTCLRLAQKAPASETVLGVFMLAMAYLLMFNPRSENTDYVFIGCIYGYGLGLAFTYRNMRFAICMGLLIIGTLFASDLSKLFSPWGSWVNPLLAAVFFVWLAIQCWLRPVEKIFILNFNQRGHKVSELGLLENNSV